MPRRPRIFLPDHPVHLIQRGHNRGKVFFTPGDGKLYVELLREAADIHGLAIHAYVLMTNHVHFLASPRTPQAVPRTMRDVNQRYSRHVNKEQHRSGSLWEGRYRASILDVETYLFSCMRYIELNPVRGGAVPRPDLWRWSSYKGNAEAKPDPLLTPHEMYLALGDTPAARAAAYRATFKDELGDDTLTAIRNAVNGGWALGPERYTDLIGRHAGRSMAARGRGRPSKT